MPLGPAIRVQKMEFPAETFLGKWAGLEPIGERIILPSNINGLKERLQLVCAERAAGNMDATTPKLWLFWRKRCISKLEYNEVCKRLGC